MGVTGRRAAAWSRRAHPDTNDRLWPLRTRHDRLAEYQADGTAHRLWRVRAAETILATGAIERGLPFANNDRPGVMTAGSALHYLNRYGVVVGRKIVLATNNGHAYETAAALSREGADVTVVDLRPASAKATGDIRVIQARSARSSAAPPSKACNWPVVKSLKPIRFWSRAAIRRPSISMARRRASCVGVTTFKASCRTARWPD